MDGSMAVPVDGHSVLLRMSGGYLMHVYNDQTLTIRDCQVNLYKMSSIMRTIGSKLKR